MPSNVFGELLRKLRRDVGKSLADFATVLGCSIAYLSAVERGVKNPLTSDEIRSILAHVGQSERVNEFFAAAANSRKSVHIAVGAQEHEVTEMMVALARTYEENVIDRATALLIKGILEKRKDEQLRPGS